MYEWERRDTTQFIPGCPATLMEKSKREVGASISRVYQDVWTVSEIKPM